MGKMTQAQVDALLVELESKSVTGSALAEKELPPVRFFVEGLLSEGFTFLAGLAKQGKSSISLSLAVAVAAGKPFLDRKTLKTDVLYLSLEMDERDVNARMNRMGHKIPSNSTFLFGWPRDGEGGVEAMDAWLTKHSTVKLVIVDSFDGVRSGISKGQGVNIRLLERQEVKTWREMAREHKAALVMIHQIAKDSVKSRRDPIEWMSGTLGLAAECDAAFVLHGTFIKALGKRWRLAVRSRSVNEHTMSLMGNKETWTWSVAKREDVERGVARKIIQSMVSWDEPFGPAEVSKETGISRALARAMVKRMGDDGRLTKVGYGLYRVPPGSVEGGSS